MKEKRILKAFHFNELLYDSMFQAASILEWKYTFDNVSTRHKYLQLELPTVDAAV